MRVTKDKKAKSAGEEALIHAIVESNAMLTATTCAKFSGGFTKLKWDERSFKQVYRHGYTNEVLPLDLIRAAIVDDLIYFNSKVWEVCETDAILT